MLMYLWMIAGFFIGLWTMQIIAIIAKVRLATFSDIIAGLIGALTVYTIWN